MSGRVEAGGNRDELHVDVGGLSPVELTWVDAVGRALVAQVLDVGELSILMLQGTPQEVAQEAQRRLAVACG